MEEFDIQKAREFVQRKQEKILRKNRELFEKAWDDFNNIVALIIERYKPKRIYQWGSLLNEEYFSEISDIDIAVEGLKSVEEYFQMYGEVSKLTDFTLDLIEIEKIEPVYAESIRKKGKLIYEKN